MRWTKCPWSPADTHARCRVPRTGPSPLDQRCGQGGLTLLSSTYQCSVLHLPQRSEPPKGYTLFYPSLTDEETKAQCDGATCSGPTTACRVSAETQSRSLAQTPGSQAGLRAYVLQPARSCATRGLTAAGQGPGHVAFEDTSPTCSGFWPRRGNGDKLFFFSKITDGLEKERGFGGSSKSQTQNEHMTQQFCLWGSTQKY